MSSVFREQGACRNEKMSYQGPCTPKTFMDRRGLRFSSYRYLVFSMKMLSGGTEGSGTGRTCIPEWEDLHVGEFPEHTHVCQLGTPAQCTFHHVQCTMHNAQCTIHNAQCTFKSYLWLTNAPLTSTRYLCILWFFISTFYSWNRALWPKLHIFNQQKYIILFLFF